MAVPLYDQLLTQAGGRTPGSPIARPTGGGRAMQTSLPSYPAPPSPTVGVSGRPSSRPVVPVGVQAPSTPTAPASSPAGPTSAGTPSTQGLMGSPTTGQPPSGKTTFQKPGEPPAPPPDPMKERMRTGGGAGSAALNGAQAAPPVLNLSRVPSRADYIGMLPGTQIGTPYGPASVGADGHPVISFPSPEHEARYRADETQYASGYGPTPLSQFPGAPSPIVRLGRPAWNPFSGTWLTPNVQ